MNAAQAADEALPPRGEWRATSSSVTTPAMAPGHAIDGDAATRWGGPFTSEHWMQIDLGRVASVGGTLLHWDSGFAASYRILASVDGRQWQTAYETSDSVGGIEYLFFPAVQARYLRLASVPRTADWGVSVFEFEPLGVADAARITGLAQAQGGASLWNPGPPQRLAAADAAGVHQLRIDLPHALSTAGLEVTWGGPRRSARLEAQDATGAWSALAEDPDPLGERSFLAARTPVTAHALRLSVQSAGATPPAIKRLRLLSPARVMTPLKRYEIVASRAHRALFPPTLLQQQTYWTAVGVPAGMQKSVFDEYGNLEPYKGAPTVQPIWRDRSGRMAVAHNATPTHSLREGWMPMPSLQWTVQPGLELRSEAFTLEQGGQPVTLLRHRLRNTGTRAVDGRLALLLRPVQINPGWQSGGVSPIREIAIEGDAAQTALRVNGRVLLHSLSPVEARGAAGFGAHGEGEITRHAVAGTVPAALTASDEDGLAAAMLGYRVQLAPGAVQDIVIAFPLGTARIDPNAQRAPDVPAVVPAIDRAALAEFDTLADEVATQWQGRLGGIGLSLPDRSLVDMLRAQGAYMLINQSGPAMQPGPRNYNRSFIRDGSASAAVLLRMGQAKVARDYLRWYADHAVRADGLVSPILDDDGAVNRGFGSDLEHDSQGQFVALVADIARLDGGPETVRDYEPRVKLALRFLQQLRERTLVPGYLADQPAPERFRGLIAPSISHEGYSVPTHSYWDDYWALKGWADGAWLANAWGDAETSRWAREQYAALHDSVAASLKATILWKKIPYVPASADLGDGDPTSVSIALDPTEQKSLLPGDALKYTFDTYLADVRKRNDPNGLWAYTPYEMRNVLTYVHLDRPRDAAEMLHSLMKDRRPPGWQVLAEVIHSRLRHNGYLGDMPHTWVGAEYARAVFGMLMHEAPDRLRLLPGTPPEWLAGPGVSLSALPTAFGGLSMSARLMGRQLHVELKPGLRAGTAVEMVWPNRQRPQRVWVDDVIVDNATAESIRLTKPFTRLVAQW